LITFPSLLVWNEGRRIDNSGHCRKSYGLRHKSGVKVQEI
jgi:hypothetical protein